MQFGPDYIKKLIDEANEIMQDDTVSETTRSAIWSCLNALQKNEKYRQAPVETSEYD